MPGRPISLIHFNSLTLKLRAILLFFYCLPFCAFAQGDSSFLTFIKPAPAFNSARFYGLVGSEAVVGAGSLIALNELWYKNHPRSPFHTFNDGREWLQMDKAGHCVTAYYLGSIGNDLLIWTGLNARKSAWLGGLTGFMYQNAIEVLDGFSSQWGFSATDFSANALGAGVFLAQQLAWKAQRVVLKYSYHSTAYAQYRPELLGRNLSQSWLKDYNGQTYWLSLNIASFLNNSSDFPQWLNLAFGYGAEGMLGANANPAVNEAGQLTPYFNRYRKAYMSLDIDLRKIKTKSALLRTLLAGFNLLKIPAPAIEFNRQGLKGHLLYF